MGVGGLGGAGNILEIREMGPSPVTPEMGNCEQRHSRNQHNFMPDLPRPAATFPLGSGDPGNVVLGQGLETTKQGRSSDLVGSSVNTSIQIQNGVFTPSCP